MKKKTNNSSQWRLIAASGSDPGQIRKTNEDSVLDFVRQPSLGEPVGVFIVADGMGGHQAGDVASRLAVDTIFDGLKRFLVRDSSADTIPSARRGDPDHGVNGEAIRMKQLLHSSVLAANLKIHQYAQEHPLEAGNLGTTLVCAVVLGDHAVIANVGDSRVYLLREAKLRQLTEDHSLVRHLINNGKIKPEDVYDHPHRSVITRALGFNPELKVDIDIHTVGVGDKLLLCSDGLWEMIRDSQDITRVMMESETPKTTVNNLIETANKNGGIDNIGVAVCEVVPRGK